MGDGVRESNAPSAGRVSILIVNWNGGGGLVACAAAAAATGAEVRLVDNASTDGSADAVIARVPGVHVLRAPENLGFAGGVNAAARAAAGDWLLLLNPDACLEARALETLREALEADPGAAAAGACLVGESGEPQRGFAVRRFPTLASIATDLLLVDELWPGNPWRRRYLALDVPLDGDRPVAVDQPAAACLMIRREAFDRLGGFDERFHPAWFEDVDFCRRAAAAGYRILFVPRARVAHAGGVSLRTLDAAAFSRVWYRNLRRYVVRHHGAIALGLVTLLIAAGMGLRVVAATLVREPARRTAAWAVLRDLLRSPRLS